MKKYTIETLNEYNQGNPYYHTVDETDVSKVNNLIELIESTRDENKPKAGDMIRITTKTGDYFPHGLIEKTNDAGAYVGESAGPPFFCKDEEGHDYHCWGSSGGSWYYLPPEQFAFIGKAERTFSETGHLRISGNPYIKFQATVNLWEYKHPEPYHSEFTTELWRRFYLTILQEPDEDGYLIYGNNIAWKTVEEYHAFVEHFKGHRSDWGEGREVLWCYRDEITMIPLEELDALDLPTITILRNARYLEAKYRHDDENKIVFHYANEQKISNGQIRYK